MSRARLSWLARVGVGVGFSAVCLVLAFRGVPFGELGEALGRANYWWLLAAGGAQWLSVLARARRWQVLLKWRVGFWELFWAHGIGFLGTNVFPFRAGEAARVLVVRQRSGVPLTQVASSAILERALDVATVLTLLFSLLPFMNVPPFALTAGLVLGGVLAAGAAALAALLLLGPRAERLLVWLARPLPARLRPLVLVRWRELLDGLSAMRDPRGAAGALFWSVTTWAFAVWMYWMVIEAVAPGAAFVEAGFIVSALSIGVSVPSSPGFVGVFQFVGQQALVGPFPDRFTLVSALSIALLAHVVYYILTSSLGVIGLLRLGVSLGTLRPGAEKPGAEPAATG